MKAQSESPLTEDAKRAIDPELEAHARQALQDAVLSSQLIQVFKHTQRCQTLFMLAEHGPLGIAELAALKGVDRRLVQFEIVRLIEYGWVCKKVHNGIRYACTSADHIRIIEKVRGLIDGAPKQAASVSRINAKKFYPTRVR